MERTYNKTFICISMTHFRYRNDVLFFYFCVSQSCGDKLVSLTDAASRSLIESAHRVICNMCLVLFVLFTSTTAEYPIMENLFSVRICTSSEPSINCPSITNKDCSLWSCPKMGKYWEKISGWQNWSSFVRAYTGWPLTSTRVWPGFKTAVHFIFNCIKWACILQVLTLTSDYDLDLMTWIFDEVENSHWVPIIIRLLQPFTASTLQHVISLFFKKKWHGLTRGKWKLTNLSTLY